MAELAGFQVIVYPDVAHMGTSLGNVEAVGPEADVPAAVVMIERGPGIIIGKHKSGEVEVFVFIEDSERIGPVAGMAGYVTGQMPI